VPPPLVPLATTRPKATEKPLREIGKVITCSLLTAVTVVLRGLPARRAAIEAPSEVSATMQSIGRQAGAEAARRLGGLVVDL